MSKFACGYFDIKHCSFILTLLIFWTLMNRKHIQTEKYKSVVLKML